MASPAFLSQPTIQRIPTLLEEVRERQIVVPKFQRPFVWDDDQRIDLMRSINEGLPIGSLMVWRTKVRLETYRLPGTNTLGDDEESTPTVRQYLLDGHQRVTTLFMALATFDTKTSIEEGQDTSEYPELRPIYFDLREEDLVLGRRRPPLKHWLPINLLFVPYRLFAFLKPIADERDGQVLMTRAEQLAGRFKDYAIPIVPIVTESLETATKSFQRVNSAGTVMSEVHMVSALTYAKNLHIAEHITEIKEVLQNDGWNEVEDQVILNACKAQLGIEFHARTIEPLVAKLEKNPEIFGQVRDALTKACRFLAHECDICGPQTLPYSYQLVLITDVLAGLDKDDIESAKISLYNWFWATTYAEYFAGMSSTRLRRALEHLRKAARGRADFLPDDLTREISPIERFDFRSARSRALALGMADCRPIDPKGEQYSAHQLLALHGRQASPKLLTKREISSPLGERFENRFIAGPGDVKLLREALLSPSHDPALAESHGIDRQATSFLERGKFSDFLNRRREFYLAEEKRFVQDLGLDYVRR